MVPDGRGSVASAVVGAEGDGRRGAPRQPIAVVTDVSGQPVTLRGWICGPDPASPDAPLLYCCAGGGCTSEYFDLSVAGHDGYSMARHLAEQGLTTVALDHPGIGASDVVADVFALTPDVVAAAHHEAATALRARLAHRGPFVGVGHSMGGMLLAWQQGTVKTFDGIVVLGHSGLGYPEVLTESELAIGGDVDRDTLQEMARTRFTPDAPRQRGAIAGRFHADDVPEAVQAAFRSQMTRLLQSCGLASMLPGFAREQKRAITVPVLIAYGDHDLTPDFSTVPSQFPASPDVTLLRVPGSGHCHHQASRRHDLWDDIARWSRGLTPADDAPCR